MTVPEDVACLHDLISAPACSLRKVIGADVRTPPLLTLETAEVTGFRLRFRVRAKMGWSTSVLMHRLNRLNVLIP